MLVEVGASGGTHQAWRALAPHAICIAVRSRSPRSRRRQSESGGYRKLHVFPAAAVADDRTEAELHLTRSPYCSSLLEPDPEVARGLGVRAAVRGGADRARPCMPLRRALEEAGVARVDWFKTDSQGTDLRLFQSLDPSIPPARAGGRVRAPASSTPTAARTSCRRALDAMDREGFWLAALAIHGTARLPAEDAGAHRRQRGPSRAGARDRPGWGGDDLPQRVSRRERRAPAPRLAAGMGDRLDPRSTGLRARSRPARPSAVRRRAVR